MAKRVQTRLKTQNRNRRIFLKEWRTYRGLTQEQLAERVGWGVSNVSQLETGRQGYSQDGLERLADALRCDPGHLLSVDPTKNDAIWSIWELAKPGDRQKIVDIARTIIGNMPIRLTPTHTHASILSLGRSRPRWRGRCLMIN